MGHFLFEFLGSNNCKKYNYFAKIIAWRFAISVANLINVLQLYITIDSHHNVIIYNRTNLGSLQDWPQLVSRMDLLTIKMLF